MESTDEGPGQGGDMRLDGNGLLVRSSSRPKHNLLLTDTPNVSTGICALVRTLLDKEQPFLKPTDEYLQSGPAQKAIWAM